ncbi:MAG TPA: TIGR02757 family protein [Spirochaetes bacterium]|nr:TIGR02757 family protein [Spirochaetota bacterium]
MKKSNHPIDKSKLEDLYKRYHTKAFLQEDPIQFVHQYKFSIKDQEVVAFIVSTLAFGQRKVMNPFIGQVLSHLGSKPYKAVYDFVIKDTSQLESLCYRFIKGIDLINLIYRLHMVLKTYDSLEALFVEGYKETESIKSAVTHFIETLSRISIPEEWAYKTIHRDRNFKFLLASPSRGSACKRFHLFLRWMVRKDNVDLGIWKKIPKKALLIPVDTHVARVSKALNLTKRKTPDWKMAEEITSNLRILDGKDPVKYDLALFGLGVSDHSL